MCARFVIAASSDEIKEYFKSIEHVKSAISHNIAPSYNVAPSHRVPIIINDRQIKVYKWGFKPVWANKQLRPQINARVETIYEKPFFRTSFQQQRCIIPVTHWFEWQDTLEGKQPYCFAPSDDKIIGLGGIYTGDTFTIITKEANTQCRIYHNRMPLIISQNYFDMWLSNKVEVQTLKTIIAKEQSPKLSIFKVTKNINKPSFNEASCIQPIS